VLVALLLLWFAYPGELLGLGRWLERVVALVRALPHCASCISAQHERDTNTLAMGLFSNSSQVPP